uniref:Uncharacterized protein n=1 Tax=Avena sativa TaxID=4498 RepID=A0ACD5UAE6_AVESA
MASDLPMPPIMESPEATPFEGAHCTIQVPPESGCGQTIFALPSDDWGIMFYIRKDRWGSFHTYPRVGGPFQSLQEAENAINCYLLERQDPNMFVGGVSDIEMRALRRKYWPDGTRKMSPDFYPVDINRNWMHQLAQSLVDKYNEDHNLGEDLAYQLKKVVCFQSICEVDVFTWCYHINFSAQTKGVGYIEDLFFAEVISKRKGEREELVPSCLRVLAPVDNGTCHGCINNGSGDRMRHPSDAAAYSGGHVRDAFLPFGGPELPPVAVSYPHPPPDCDFDFEAAEETRLHNLLTGPEAHAFQKYMSLPCSFTPVPEEMMEEWLALCDP